jgi:hypothetical protein
MRWNVTASMMPDGLYEHEIHFRAAAAHRRFVRHRRAASFHLELATTRSIA